MKYYFITKKYQFTQYFHKTFKCYDDTFVLKWYFQVYFYGKYLAQRFFRPRTQFQDVQNKNTKIRGNNLCISHLK